MLRKLLWVFESVESGKEEAGGVGDGDERMKRDDG